MAVRTRFAPSPTGYLHIGGARTALFNWLFARHHGGQFVLRVEDTDRERSTDASVEAILAGMAWLGLDADEGPFFQTERFDRYREVIQQLLDAGHAYACYSSPDELEAMRESARSRGEKPRYDGTWRDSTAAAPVGIEPVIRFRNPTSGSVVIDDAIKGRIVIDNAELDDLVIQRADGSPTYNLSVVVDDMDMAITHVIRGDDHINNTPRQINILDALGAARPIYAHLPMILGEDGKRMSKRHGAVGVMQYRDDGYPADALLNYLVRLGWSHGDDERFTREEMIALFTLEGVNRAGAVFDRKKLDSVSQSWLQVTDAQTIATQLKPYLQALDIDPAGDDGRAPLAAIVEPLRDRSRTLLDMAEQAVPFHRAPSSYDEKLARKLLTPDGAVLLQAARDRLAGVAVSPSSDRWEASAVQNALEAVASEQGVGFGKVGQPLRLAITGGGASPSMSDVLALLAPADVLGRLDAAIGHARDAGRDPTRR